MELEDTYKIGMSEEEAAGILTVGQAVDFVHVRLGGAAGG
jgi:acyl carrier protein